MATLDPSILLQTKPVDLTSLGESLNPANIMAKGLALKQQRQTVNEQNRLLNQQKLLRDKLSQFDVSTPEGKQAYLNSVKSDPLTSDKYLDAMNAFTEQQQKTAQLGVSQAEADVAGAKTPLIMGYIKRFTNPQSTAADDPNLPLHERLLTLKNKVTEDEAAKAFGLPVPPDNSIAYNQAVVQAKQELQDALGSPEWQAKIRSIQPGKTNEAAILERQFYAEHPVYAQLPEELKKTYHDAFVAPQQPSMGTIMLQQSGASSGLGGSLAQQVASGNLDGKTAQQMIIGNKLLTSTAKEKALIDLASSVPELGGKYTLPQLQVFAKNSTNPQFNTQSVAIDALTPNIRELMALSDKYGGRVDMPALNKLINSGNFQVGDQTITNMNQLQSIIAEEAGKVFGGAATSDFKIKLGGDLVDLSLSGPNFKSNLKMLEKAMNNKKKALQDAMGPYSPWKDENLGGHDGNGSTGKKPGNQIPTINSKEEFDRLPSGSDYWDNGVRYTKP